MIDDGQPPYIQDMEAMTSEITTDATGEMVLEVNRSSAIIL